MSRGNHIDTAIFCVVTLGALWACACAPTMPATVRVDQAKSPEDGRRPNASPDEVLYQRAVALRERATALRAQDDPSTDDTSREVRQVWMQLIKNYPTSRYVPHAYLDFADFYFEEGQMENAERFYERVVSFTNSDVYGYALYKRGWVSLNLQDDREALSRFVEVLQYAAKQPSQLQAAHLAERARRDLIAPYSRVGRPAQSLHFFRRLAPGHELEMVERLAAQYEDSGQWSEARTTWHSLMAEAPTSDRLCEWQCHVARGARTRPADQWYRELRRSVDLMNVFVSRAGPTITAGRCRRATAQVIFEAVAQWYRETQATRDQDTMRRALLLSEVLLQQFADLDQLSLELVDGAQPNLARVRQWRNDLTQYVRP